MQCTVRATAVLDVSTASVADEETASAPSTIKRINHDAEYATRQAFFYLKHPKTRCGIIGPNKTKQIRIDYDS